ncbi:MAG: tetraacyldisaccharide 4'-kinase [Phycisphaeraceae bacterium]|nr:tetraacyldisaccharide 4'-kinase [Phycisphaeraceae bacterium]
MMSGEARGPKAGLLRAGLEVLMPGYAAAVAARNAMFDHGLRSIHRLGRPTISVGNLTTGGTGKTPMVIDLARRLGERGRRPAVLLRGYKADADQRSDEAMLLSEALGPGMPVAANADRSRAAREVLSAGDVDVFLLDDGFQHRQAHRDLNVVLIDALNPWGYGRLLPRGLLREPTSSLRRADAVIVTRADQVSPAALAELDRQIERHAGRPPIAHTAHGWREYLDAQGRFIPIDVVRGEPVVGVCGLANPGAFERSLRQAAADVRHCMSFPDHHAYTPADVQRIASRARQSGAAAVVTSEKDWVKLRDIDPAVWQGLAVRRAVLGLRWLDGLETFWGLIERAVPGPDRAGSGA